MADGFIQEPPDATGKKIDTEQTATTCGNVQRQRLQAAGAAAAELAEVGDADPSGTEYGLTTRDARLKDILTELNTIIGHLS
jgi:hypothetical protein